MSQSNHSVSAYTIIQPHTQRVQLLLGEVEVGVLDVRLACDALVTPHHLPVPLVQAQPAWLRGQASEVLFEAYTYVQVK